MKSKKLQLLNGNILIKEEIPEEKFGIKSESLSVKAEIMGVGPDVYDVKIGDIVYMSKYSGLPYKDMRIVQEHDILVKEI